MWPWLEVMSLKSLGHGGFESKYQREGDRVEKDGEIVGERDRGKVRNN